MPPTHDVVNVVDPLVGFDVAAADPALAAGLAAAGTTPTEPLRSLAVDAGAAEWAEQARLADRNPPVLHTHDRAGRRVDEIEYHPSWHRLMGRAVGAGLQAAPWAPDAGAHAHLHRAAGFYLWTQTESGHLCPISMTYAAVPALRHDADLAREFEPGLCSPEYDFGLRPAAAKRGLLAGMSMTEKQGGSDVRAATTRAVPEGDAGHYRLTGHKWFTSAPMNDLFLTLAQAPGGLSCFVVPRVLPDGQRNAVSVLRLKDKLGNRSNASGEIEYDGALARRLGEEGRGVPTILEMVTMTRLDCVLGSAGQIRAGLSQAAYYAAHRRAFGRRLIEHEAMAAVLADLAVESWAATLTGLRLADLVDDRSPAAATLLRLALPAAKFWICKRAVPVLAEALECLGGNGYVETFPTARLLREAPLNGIWEGSGTVTALDAVRALGRSPECAQALLAELAGAAGGHPAFDSAVRELTGLLRQPPDPATARRLCSLTARTLAAGLLLRHAPAPVAELYCATRLGWSGDRVFGEVPPGTATAGIVESITPSPR
ncbi:acyl-CoA dehydrogenase family protein [Nakamurella multipartita]|uniref:Acyl-CoA dehydrogenase domain protein n=1 Tax=Nakamurella multipartita (strain ATCC 700099 / DSM 44233 / CIP 104796 / JCM 9543 / NBRC 105858 / Y-104) TaxID=479431 RepID=C8XKQ6_NAKMY|nr:acyl-CoA dehydrogenase family protein [Nakamurella multipartita]ACV80713.1 acyl-CoA dehydrogenase domain protein [Nakamurella multipartita DSM 44233]